SGGNGGVNSTITGNYKFVSTYAVTSSSVQYSFLGSVYKTVTVSDYTSINNVGTVNITSNTLASNGIGYSISDTAIAYSYVDGTLIDTIQSPFDVTIPPTSSTVTYKQISADSIYVPAQGGSMAAGYHITVNGNILTMTSSIVHDTAVNVSGVTASQHSTAKSVTTLQKQ
ncbi:MAG: hypothetical protein JST39_18520, partial [Bacteroidetes bacterium]|nr:hypothetical protein [Bacteroidota bacterium]